MNRTLPPSSAATSTRRCSHGCSIPARPVSEALGGSGTRQLDRVDGLLDRWGA